MAHAEWTRVTKSERGDDYYLNVKHIKKHKGKIYFWLMVDFLKPGPNTLMSTLSYHEAECSAFRIRILRVASFNGPKGKGKTLNSFNAPKEELQYTPLGSPFRAVLNKACNHKILQ